MNKPFVSLFFFLIVCNIYSQDEYNPPKKQEEETQLRTSPDSIKIVNKEEEKITDKSFKGISSFRRNMRIGGGLNLGSYYDGNVQRQLAALGISPQLTFILSEVFEGGLTTSYGYLGSFGDINLHSLSAGPILRAYPLESLFLQLEGVGFYSTLSIKGYSSISKMNFNAFVGGGYIVRLSQTSYILTGIKVNLMKNELTNNQIFPVPFTSIHFGLWQ